MKYRVTIEGSLFEVEVEDLNTRPIVARVNGERFEVWPEAMPTAQPAESQTSTPTDTEVPVPKTTPLPQQVEYDFEQSPDVPRKGRANSILAPIPGTIISIGVKSGEQVFVGQEVCVLDAMKMESPIRAPRAGKIATIYVTEGENVKHHQLLMEYAD